MGQGMLQNEMDRLDWDYIVDILAWDVQEKIDYDALYHYYSGPTLRKVLTKDAIVFRLAAAATFEDKMEGKAVEVYYDLALSELVSEGAISPEQYDAFSKASVPDKIFLPRKTNSGINAFGNSEFEEYIICFSTKENDPYMFENYIKNADGYCLHFSGMDLRELTCKGIDNQAEIKLIPVLYGRKVVDYIREKLLMIASNPIRTENYNEYISVLLHYVQYAAKLNKYSKENEVRLVVFRNKNAGDMNVNGVMNRIDDGKYLLFSIGKEVLYKVTPAPYNGKIETVSVMDYLEDSGYPHM